MSVNKLRRIPPRPTIDPTAREEAEELLEMAVELPPGSAASIEAVSRAAVYATLAQADATDRLTAAIENLAGFPELAVKKSLGGLGWSVKPVDR